jgi:hypothetical protein
MHSPAAKAAGAPGAGSVRGRGWGGVIQTLDIAFDKSLISLLFATNSIRCVNRHAIQ